MPWLPKVIRNWPFEVNTDTMVVTLADIHSVAGVNGYANMVSQVVHHFYHELLLVRYHNMRLHSYYAEKVHEDACDIVVCQMD